MKLDDKTLELIAIGASITAGCHHCISYHADKAGKLGAGTDEIAEAIAVGRMVRGGSASQMDKYVESMTDDNPTGSPADDTSDISGSTDTRGV